MRSKKAIINISFSLIYQITAIVCGLITPRLILLTFGSTYNGVFQSVTQFLSMISLLTVGITGATRVELYKTLANGDILGTSKIVKANENYMKKVGYMLLLYAAILAVVYPFISNNDLAWYECTIIIAIVTLGSFMQYYFGVAYATLLIADQKEYVQSIILTITTILNVVFTFVLIKLGFNIFIVKLVSSIVFAITPIYIYIYVKRHYNLVKDCEGNAKILKLRGAAAFQSIANTIHDQTDIAVLTVFMDAKVLSVYAVYNIVIKGLRSLKIAFTNSLEATFGNMWAKNEKDNLSKNFSLYETCMYSFVVIVFTCTGLLLIPFVTLYTRGVDDIEYVLPTFAALVTLTEAFYCIRQPYVTMVQATGSYEETKIGALVEAVVNLVLSIILVAFIGLNGVMIGTLAANIIRTVEYTWFTSKHLLKRSIKSVIYRFIWTALSSCIILAVSAPLMGVITIDGWFGWLVKAVTVFAVSAIITLIADCIFYKNDMKNAFAVFGNIFHHEKV